MPYALIHIWRVKHGITSDDETSNHAISDPFAYSFKIEMKIHSIQGNNLHKLFPVHCTLRFFFFAPFQLLALFGISQRSAVGHARIMA